MRHSWAKLILIVMILSSLMVFSPHKILAGPSSTNYQLKSYGFGAGGDSMSSTNYKAHGIVGEFEAGRSSSTNYKAGSGLTYTLMANVPPAPSFTNPSSNYDRLKLVINTGSNAADTTYAVAISSDNFVTTQYVQSDFTVGTTNAPSTFMTYTTWGGASGVYITGLNSSTTYTVKVKARKGSYTETGYGPTASAITTTPSLTFGLDAVSLAFSNLNAANSYTDSTKSTVLTTSTNAYNGYVVNARVTGPLTSGVNTIANYASPNSAPTIWSGTGFGYTTNDNDLTGGTNTRFSSATKYAGFTTASPGDPVADHAGPVTTAIANETFTVSYRVTTNSSQTAGTYTTTVLYMVVPSY